VPIVWERQIGTSDGNTRPTTVKLPSIEHQGLEILSITALRSGGRLLTDGDIAIVGLSHQNDILPGRVLNDQDDFLTDDPEYDLWWMHGLSESDHVLDRLDVPQLVAGPQTVLFFNGTGGVSALTIGIEYRVTTIPSLQQWTLLLHRTSYETSH